MFSIKVPLKYYCWTVWLETTRFHNARILKLVYNKLFNYDISKYFAVSFTPTAQYSQSACLAVWVPKYCHENTVADCWPSLLFQDCISLKSVSDEDMSVSVVCSLLLVKSLGCVNADKSFRIFYVCAIFFRSLHIKNTEWKQRTIFIIQNSNVTL
jgi:hypothetical protein